MSDDSLLTIGQASRVLSVSEPALRQWTDEGQIKAFITPGGHRRYLRSELKKFIGLNQKRLGIRSLTERLGETVPVHREIGETFLHSHSEEIHPDGDVHQRFASLGRQLLSLLTQCVTRPSRPEETLSTAREIGAQYGSLTAELRMPLVDSVSAFVRHRPPIVGAVFEMMRKGELPERQIAEAIPLIDKAIDEALVALISIRELSAKAIGIPDNP